jgi:hypothetical protein
MISLYLQAIRPEQQAENFEILATKTTSPLAAQ